MNSSKCTRDRYLYAILVVASVLIVVACQDHALDPSNETTVTDFLTGIEQALNEDIPNQIALAESRIEEFRKLGNGSAALAAGKHKKKVLMVHPGESIQAAVDAADPGTTLLVKPGVYSEAITINKSGLTLIGLGGPVSVQATLLVHRPARSAAAVVARQLPVAPLTRVARAVPECCRAHG